MRSRLAYPQFMEWRSVFDMSKIDQRSGVGDAVYKLVTESTFKAVQNDDLAKSLNTLRTVPGAPNPFVVNPRRAVVAVPIVSTSVQTGEDKSQNRRS